MTKIFLVIAAAAIALSATPATAKDTSLVNGTRYTNQPPSDDYAYMPREAHAARNAYVHGPRAARWQSQESWYDHNQAEQLRINSQ